MGQEWHKFSSTQWLMSNLYSSVTIDYPWPMSDDDAHESSADPLCGDVVDFATFAAHAGTTT
jgi:hypothetical protein